MPARVAAFSLLARILGECSTIRFPAYAFFYFLKWTLACPQVIALFMPKSVHSGSASWDDRIGFRVYASSGVTCHLHFWQNDWGLLCGAVVTRGVEWTQNKNEHTVNSKEETSPANPAGIQTHNLSITSPVLFTNKLSWLPILDSWQIHSVIKCNIYFPWTQMEKKIL